VKLTARQEQAIEWLAKCLTRYSRPVPYMEVDENLACELRALIAPIASSGASGDDRVDGSGGEHSRVDLGRTPTTAPVAADPFAEALRDYGARAYNQGCAHFQGDTMQAAHWKARADESERTLRKIYAAAQAEIAALRVERAELWAKNGSQFRLLGEANRAAIIAESDRDCLAAKLAEVRRAAGGGDE